MEFKSINPYNGRSRCGVTSLTLVERVSNGKAFVWRKVPLAERCKLLKQAGQVLRDNVEEYAQMINGNGKPIVESRSEVTKCTWVCDYYAENAPAFLADETISTDAHKNYVRHDPIGGILAIMPWNFPFWQVFRYAAPTLTAGNCRTMDTGLMYLAVRN